MKQVWMGLALAAGVGGMAHAQASYSGDRAIAGAETAAKAASFACETELKAGGKGTPGCERYHTAVLLALTLEGRRLAWCQTQTTSEASNVRIPDSCFSRRDADMRVDVVSELERKRSPATWRKFDQAMARLP
jgi:hypothetical protein